MAAGWGTPRRSCDGEPGPDAASTAADDLAERYDAFLELIEPTRPWQVIDDPPPDPDRTEADKARTRAAVTDWWSSTAADRKGDLP